jgi:hypothetical protein
LFVFVVSTKIERKKKDFDFLGFSDKSQTERAVFFCMSFSGKKNKRVETDETDTGRRGGGGEVPKGKGKRRRRALKAFCPQDTCFVRPSLEYCFDCCH